MPDPTIELVMAEFGAERQNAGGADFRDSERLNPTLDSFREQFPDARVTLYTDFDYAADGIDTVVVDPPFDRAHPRYGWRANNYYHVYGLLQSSADVAIAMDSDMLIVSERFRTIVAFVEKFGFALPPNSRLQVCVDVRVGIDPNYDLSQDPTGGTGFAYNMTPLAFATKHEGARRLLERYLRYLRERHGRGGLRLWQAVWDQGFNPYLLPPQWCVCRPSDIDSRYIWSDAIALHVGHPDVYPHYVKMAKRRARKATRDQYKYLARRRLRRLLSSS